MSYGYYDELYRLLYSTLEIAYGMYNVDQTLRSPFTGKPIVHEDPINQRLYTSMDEKTGLYSIHLWIHKGVIYLHEGVVWKWEV